MTNERMKNVDKSQLKIVDIFITPENLLGVALFNGVFIKLLNTKMMTIGLM